jgi:hypothetical protein
MILYNIIFNIRYRYASVPSEQHPASCARYSALRSSTLGGTPHARTHAKIDARSAHMDSLEEPSALEEPYPKLVA